MKSFFVSSGLTYKYDTIAFLAEQGHRYLSPATIAQLKLPSGQPYTLCSSQAYAYGFSTFSSA
ncbi:uncharacterized protein TrAtP1_011604 [Trichoderma atroviride]|uniref:uncharacterized protein n=1 Tax=Hypocrea atroviridis TaxID=63577 RepID=UPI00332316A5|nr:hypothetical protein TrAtP1_011604 [Trichoderma atroviride]